MADEFIEHDLDEWLDVAVPTEPAPGPGEEEPIAPAPDATFANRLLWKAMRLAEERRGMEDLAAARKAEIDAWLEDRVAGNAREEHRVRQSLELFMRTHHRDHPRTKTLKLPHGVLTLRSGRGKVVLENPHAMVAWAREHSADQLLRWEPVPSKDALKALPDRHPGTQQAVRNSRGEDELCHTWRLMATVAKLDEEGTPVLDGDGQPMTEQVSVPGAFYAEPVQDRFDYSAPEGDAHEESPE